MATYSAILRQVALRSGMLRGDQVEGLQTSYTTNPLTQAEIAILQDSPIPLTALTDAVLNAESGLVMAVAGTGNHPFRQSLIDQTIALSYGDRIPVTGSTGAKVVGEVYGAVIDVASSEPCTENQLEQIRDRVLNPNNLWLITVYWYAINDRRIYHTVSTVKIDVCVYDRPDALTLVLTTAIALPDVLVPAYVDGALMELSSSDRFANKGEKFGSIYSGWISAIKQGMNSVDSATKIIQSQKAA